MSELSVSQSTDFYLEQVAIVTKSGTIDIKEIFEEISVFDSLFLPVINGQIMITDSLGLSNKLLFDGSETLLITIKKDANSDVASFRKAFRIYKQTNRRNLNQGTEAYILHFVSDELLFSDQQRVNQSYTGKYSEIVERIMLDYLKIPKNNLTGLYQDTAGVRKVVIPNLRPIEAIEWCSKRAVDLESSPNYVFFQNISGYNFVSLSKLLTLPEILDVKFQPKNTSNENSLSEISSARSFEVVSQNDSMEKIRSGVNAGKFIGFDPLTRTVSSRGISFLDVYSSMKHGNDKPNASDVKNRAGESIYEAFDSHKVVNIVGTARKYSQRKAILKHLMSKRLKFVMPGNFQLSSGFNVNVMIPELGLQESNVSEEDKTLSGRHLIVNSRQIITFDKHETIIEVASTSTNQEFIASDNPNQTAAIQEY
jgi:hypothetical protein